MSTGKNTPFPLTPEQMKWPFRTKEEQEKIIKWSKKRGKVNDVELAPYLLIQEKEDGRTSMEVRL